MEAALKQPETRTLTKKGSLLNLKQGILSDITDPFLKVRLYELGFITGRSIRVLRKSPINDYVMVLVSGQVFGLRKDEAAQILVTN
jgi:Fe2+ transport system protein FeoA